MNKVSLAEAGDGSPPFYLKNSDIEDVDRFYLERIQDVGVYRPAESGTKIALQIPLSDVQKW